MQTKEEKVSHSESTKGTGPLYFFRKYRNQRTIKELKKRRLLTEKELIPPPHNPDEINNENKNVIDSLNYAGNIQQALSPKEKHLLYLFDSAFILNKPKDIVGGDFYWFTKIQGKIIVFLADCSGHGIPAAFMSILGTSLLSHIVHEENNCNPALILQRLDYKIKKAFDQNDLNEDLTSEGMDAAVCTLDYENNIIYYSGAQRPLYLSQNGEINVFNGSKHMVGGFLENEKCFENKVIPFSEGDNMYLFTDGYHDQLGGATGRKFMASNFKNFISEIQNLPMLEQKNLLTKNFDTWKANNHQTDDVLVMGITL